MSDTFVTHCADVLGRWGWRLERFAWHFVPGSTAHTMGVGAVTDLRGRRADSDVMVAKTGNRLRRLARMGVVRESVSIETVAAVGRGWAAAVTPHVPRLSSLLISHRVTAPEATWLAVSAATLTVASRGRIAAIPEATSLVEGELTFHAAALASRGDQHSLLLAYLRDLAGEHPALGRLVEQCQPGVAGWEQFAYRAARLLDLQIPELAAAPPTELAGWEPSLVPLP